MSLINRMLRDLSTRQPATGDVMSGIQPPGAEAAPRGGLVGRLAALAALVVVFTAGLGFVFGPRPAKIPQPRPMPPEAIAAAAQAPQAEPAPAMAPPAAEPEPASPPPSSAAAEAPAPVPAAVAPPPAEARPAIKAAAPKARAPRPVKQPAATGRTGPQAYRDARRALDRGDEQAADAALQEALAKDPALHAAREELGNLRIRQGRLDDAESVARAGLAIDPSYIGYRRLAARLELARDRPAVAAELLEREPPPLERDIEYHALLVSAWQRLGRHEQAARGYEALARAEPYQAMWWAGYGLSRDALGDAPGALAAYARARQLGGLDPRVLEHIDRRTRSLQQAGTRS
ncbi:MAG: tetratricopeptide repeat protein [Gammaproteobacteria bacterium]